MTLLAVQGSGPKLVTTLPGWATRVQRTWSEQSIATRARVLRTFRHRMSHRADAIVQAIAAEYRTPADVRISEILPLLAACEYLEKNAPKILAVRQLGAWGRPIWLGGVRSEVQHVPLGCVLVIGPSNYPLFLPGVQVLQALVAGNAVCWKPGRGGAEVARLFEREMAVAGLPPELLRVTDDSVETGRAVVAAGADKVFFTGSASSGRAIMRELAGTTTPSVMELSGCSSVIVMPGSDLERVTAAVVFGTRLNGSATCMAPRRILVVGDTKARRDALVRRLQDAFITVAPVRLPDATAAQLRELVAEARAQGATLLGDLGEQQKPLLLVNARPSMRIAQADLFAPVLSIIDVAEEEDIAAAERVCPLALTVSIFGDQQKARHLARGLAVGTVVINDMIVPTADPRLPFGGRRGSGFGVTRGAEGLLEMTAIRNITVRGGDGRRQYAPTGEAHTRLFDGLILAGHAGTWRQRWRGFRQMVQAASTMKPEKWERHDGE